MPKQIGAGCDFSVKTNNQVGARILGSMAPPRGSLVLHGRTDQNKNTLDSMGRYSWRLVSLLSLNYLSISDTRGGTGRVALQEVLELFADSVRSDAGKLLEGIVDVSSKPIVRRVPFPGTPSFARGLEVGITVNEKNFEGIGPFVFGAVMDRFLSKFVSMNSFVETVLLSTQRKEIMRWPARIGQTSSL